MKNNKLTASEIQQDLDELSLLKFKVDKKFNDFTEVIKWALDSSLNKNYPFQYGDNSTVIVKNNRINCGKSRRRGFADIYRLVKYYFPSTTFMDIYNNIKHYDRYFCNTTHQTVFKPYKYQMEQLPVIKIRMSDRKLKELNLNN